MPGMTPYDIVVVTATGEYPLITVLSDNELSDADAKTAAKAVAQEIVDKINAPSPDTLVVRRGLIGPGPFGQHQARYWLHQNNSSAPV